MTCGKEDDIKGGHESGTPLDAAALRKALLVYAVTDRAWLGGKSLSEQVEDALKGGASFIQLREKELDESAFLKEAFEIKKLAQQYKVPFVINDNVEIAIQCGADGVHVGQSDMRAAAVRKRLGENKILGVSVSTVEEAIQAVKDGADYLGVGAVFSTLTKSDADQVSYNQLKEICNAVTIPVVAIGGITRENIDQLYGSGIQGVALVSAIFGAENIQQATNQLVVLAKQLSV
ncbi:thiamine phosphate synthase [Clostridium aminobutyricum]|uniref:Thiamine-phosphate synthase n=1 Tax=Clostridium aminobutyricum TaxID=33953 RepID=A0A939D7Z6_CLOAM|nr:thiamine phosphate synthase [Clostridium aminobutyricum]MBN7773104.1 thiamine phosphate synthase [Clostridium aminobutyricum]